MVKKTLIGSVLLFVILSMSFYMLLPDKVRIDFTKTRTIFSVYENEKFVISGIEYTRIFDGTKLMRAKNRDISFTINDDTTEWYRIANFKDDIIVEDFVSFENEATDVEDVPIFHEACFTNANGKIFEYLISDITYNDDSKNIISPFAFEKNMKVTFQDGYHIAKVVNNKIAKDKIIIRYRIKSDYECFNVRLFDPIESIKPRKALNTKYTYNSKVEEYSDGTGNAIIGGQIYVDSSGTKIEDAYSLKDCEFCDRIKLEIQSDGKHILKVLDYNITTIKVEASLLSSELNKDIPLKVLSKNKTELSSIDINLKYTNDKPEIILSFGFDKEIHFGENSTTIKITNSTYKNWIDVTSDSGDNNDIQIKVNISAIPNGASNIDSKLCTWIEDTSGSMDNEVKYHRINDQTWDVSLTTGEYDSQVETNETSTIWSSILDESWSCFNNTNVVATDVSLGNDFATTRFEAVLYPHGGTTSSLSINQFWLNIGDLYNPLNYFTYYGTASGNAKVSFQNVTYDINIYSLNITDPTTSAPNEVSPEDETTIIFDFKLNGVNKTTDVTKNNVTIGGTFANTVTYAGCSGTLDCSVYIAEAQCNNCSQCNWSSVPLFQSEFETFEVDHGNWDYTGGDPGCDFDRDQDGTTSSNTGPQPQGSAPGANSTDWYVFVEASSGQCNAGEQAYLVGPAIDLDTYPNSILTFSYSMYGATMGTLNVQLNTSGTWSTIWSISGDQGISPVWTGVTLDLTGNTSILAVRFEYDRDNPGGYTGDIALDHINISQQPSIVCSATGSCSACPLNECDTNCSSGGCSQSTIDEFGYVANSGWNWNVTVPAGCSGTVDLFVNATFDGVMANDTQTGAIICAGDDTCSCPGLNEYWEIDLTDECQINDNCDLGTGRLNFTNVGFANCNATVTTTGLGDPGANSVGSDGTLYIQDNCILIDD